MYFLCVYDYVYYMLKCISQIVYAYVHPWICLCCKF